MGLWDLIKNIGKKRDTPPAGASDASEFYGTSEPEGNSVEPAVLLSGVTHTGVVPDEVESEPDLGEPLSPIEFHGPGKRYHSAPPRDEHGNVIEHIIEEVAPPADYQGPTSEHVVEEPPNAEVPSESPQAQPPTTEESAGPRMGDASQEPPHVRKMLERLAKEQAEREKELPAPVRRAVGRAEGRAEIPQHGGVGGNGIDELPESALRALGPAGRIMRGVPATIEEAVALSPYQPGITTEYEVAIEDTYDSPTNPPVSTTSPSFEDQETAPIALPDSAAGYGDQYDDSSSGSVVQQGPSSHTPAEGIRLIPAEETGPIDYTSGSSSIAPASTSQTPESDYQAARQPVLQPADVVSDQAPAAPTRLYEEEELSGPREINGPGTHLPSDTYQDPDVLGSDEEPVDSVSSLEAQVAAAEPQIRADDPSQGTEEYVPEQYTEPRPRLRGTQSTSDPAYLQQAGAAEPVVSEELPKPRTGFAAAMDRGLGRGVYGQEPRTTESPYEPVESESGSIEIPVDVDYATSASGEEPSAYTDATTPPTGKDTSPGETYTDSGADGTYETTAAPVTYERTTGEYDAAAIQEATSGGTEVQSSTLEKLAGEEGGTGEGTGDYISGDAGKTRDELQVEIDALYKEDEERRAEERRGHSLLGDEIIQDELGPQRPRRAMEAGDIDARFEGGMDAAIGTAAMTSEHTDVDMGGAAVAASEADVDVSAGIGGITLAGDIRSEGGKTSIQGSGMAYGGGIGAELRALQREGQRAQDARYLISKQQEKAMQVGAGNLADKILMSWADDVFGGSDQDSDSQSLGSAYVADLSTALVRGVPHMDFMIESYASDRIREDPKEYFGYLEANMTDQGCVILDLQLDPGTAKKKKSSALGFLESLLSFGRKKKEAEKEEEEERYKGRYQTGIDILQALEYHCRPAEGSEGEDGYKPAGKLHGKVTRVLILSGKKLDRGSLDREILEIRNLNVYACQKIRLDPSEQVKEYGNSTEYGGLLDVMSVSDTVKAMYQGKGHVNIEPAYLVIPTGDGVMTRWIPSDKREKPKEVKPAEL
jgi:hypothetical protein